MATTADGELGICKSATGKISVGVRLERETLWLTQRQMVDAFATTRDNGLTRVNGIFANGDLELAATTKDYLVVRAERKRHLQRNLYNCKRDSIAMNMLAKPPA